MTRTEIERALIALALLDNEVADLVAALPEDAFTHAVFSRVAALIRQFRTRGELCDPFVIAAHLPELERKPVMDACMDSLGMLDGRSRSELAQYYIKLLMSHSVAQTAARSFKVFAERLSSNPLATTEVLSEANALLNELLSQLSLQDEEKDLRTEVREAFAAKRIPIATTLWDLDNALRSVSPGDLFVVAGRTSVGKTAFAIQMATQTAAYGASVLYITLEMRRSEILFRFFSHLGFIPMGWFFSPQPEKLKLPLSFAIERFNRLKIKIIDSSSYTKAFDIPELVVALQKYSPQVVVIDYLHLMASARSESMVEALADLSRELKQLALRYNCVIVALSQISRTAHPSDADLEQIYYSSALAHAASQVLMLRPKAPPKANSKIRLVELFLAKNRNGPVVSVAAHFIPSLMRFCQVAPTDDLTLDDHNL